MHTLTHTHARTHPSCTPRFLITAYFINWGEGGWHLAANFILLVILVVAKLPEMHGIRLFGINRAAAMEDE